MLVENIIYIVGISINLIEFEQIRRVYKKYKLPQFLLLEGYLLFITLGFILRSFTLDDRTSMLNTLSFIPASIGIIFFICLFDILRKNKVARIKFLFLIAIMTVIMYLELQGEYFPSQFLDTTQYLEVNFLVNLNQLILGGVVGIDISQWLLQIKKRASAEIRARTYWMLSIGVFLSVMIIIWSIILNIDFVIMTPLIAAIIAIILGDLIVKFNQLILLVPFDLYRLTIYRNASKDIIYEHKWKEHAYQEVLMDHFLKGIQEALNDTFQRGYIKRFVFEKGALIFSQSEGITTILYASNSSEILKNSLKNFQNDFIRFHTNINEDGAILGKNFIDSTLLKKYFLC